MTLYEILINVLIFCGIVLLIVLIVAAIQSILLLVDIRRTSREVKKKIYTITSVLDIVSLLLGGVDEAKRRISKKLKPSKSTLIAFAAGLKKGLNVLLKGKGGKE